MWCPECEDVFDVLHCPLCGAEMDFGELSEFTDAPEDERPAPVLPGWLQPVFEAHSALGRDQRGVPTVVEQRAWLDEHEITDLDERRVWQALWAAISAAEMSERAKTAERIADRSDADRPGSSADER